MKLFLYLFLLCPALIFPILSGAQDTAQNYESMLFSYENGISQSNPETASDFLKDNAFFRELNNKNPKQAAELYAQASALQDLKELLEQPWTTSREKELRKAISIRLDSQTPLSKIGFDTPEKLLPWAKKYLQYNPEQLDLLGKAILEFKIVFGKDATEGKKEWDAASIKTRTLIVERRASEVLLRVLNGIVPSEDLQTVTALQYLSQADQAVLQRYVRQSTVAKKAKPSLPAAHLAEINRQPLEQQIYLLGEFFDKNKNKGSLAVRRAIDAERTSTPGETLAHENNVLLTDKLKHALKEEIQDTEAGQRVLAVHELEIAIELCQGCYAKYEPVKNKIVIDAELIAQYLRVNNLTTEALLNSQAALIELAKYTSPIVLHEAIHHSQHTWADDAGLYKPYTQEDEIEANSAEALYTLEKLKTDYAFRTIFTTMRDYTAYAGQRLLSAQLFYRNPVEFGERIRMSYYPNLPSLNLARAKLLKVINAEFERRASLNEAQLHSIDESSYNTDEVMRMTPQELAGAAGLIKDKSLYKIQKDMLSQTAYAKYYSDSASWARAALTRLNYDNSEAKPLLEPKP